MSVYNKLVNSRMFKNVYPKLDKNFFKKIIKGHCNLRILAYKNMQAMGEIEKCQYSEYAKMLNEFLTNEISRLTQIDKCIDIFRDFQASQDEFEQISK